MSGSEFEGKKDASSHIDRLLHYTPGPAYLSAYRREWFRSVRIAGAVVFAVLLPSNLALGGVSRICCHACIYPLQQFSSDHQWT